MLIAAGGYLLSRQASASRPMKTPSTSTSTPTPLVSTPHGSTIMLVSMGHPLAGAATTHTCAAAGAAGRVSHDGGPTVERDNTGAPVPDGPVCPSSAHCINMAHGGCEHSPKELASLLGSHQAPGAVIEKMSARLAAAYAAISNGAAVQGAVSSRLTGLKQGGSHGIHAIGWYPAWATGPLRYWRCSSQRAIPTAPAGLLRGTAAQWEPGTTYMLCVAAMWSVTVSMGSSTRLGP